MGECVRTRYLLTVAAVALAIGACTESAVTSSPGPPPDGSGPNSLQRVLERGVLRVGTTGDFHMSFIDPDTGERGGYDIDLTRKLAQDMGVEIEYVATDWPSLVSGLTAGRYDITTGASFNAGRARTASYTLTISRVGTVAVIRPTDEARFTTWDAINRSDVRVAVRRGSVFEDQARYITPDAEVRTIAAPAAEYQEVLEHRADVAIMSSLDAAALVHDRRQLRIAPVEPHNANYLGMLVPQGHHELRAFIDAWIRAQEYSGFIDELTAKWGIAF